jgi:WD40 repeat protein
MPAGAPGKDQPLTASPIVVQCSACGKELKARAELAGKKVKCPHCGKATRLPELGPAVARKRSFSAARVWLLTLLGLVPVGLVLLLGFTWLFRHARPPALSFLNVTLGEEFVPGVEEAGFHWQEFYRGQPFRWTDGRARLVIPLDRAKPPEALLVQVAALRERQVRKAQLEIVVNKRSLFKGDIPLGYWERRFDLGGTNWGEQLVLDLLSDTFVPLGSKRGGGQGVSADPRALGVQVQGIKLLRGEAMPAAGPVRVIQPWAEFSQAHPHGIAFGALTPDGRTLVFGGWDGTITIWDVAANIERKTMKVLGVDLKALAVSPHGETFATVGNDRAVHLWDTDTGQPRGTFTGLKGQVLALAYSPDGKTLAAAGDDTMNGGELKLWDLGAGTERVPIEAFPFRLWGLAYAPDGKSVAVVGGERTAQVVDTTTGQVLTSFPLPFNGRRVAFSPDGKLLAVAYGQDGRVRLVEPDSGKTRADVQVPDGQPIFDLAFARDGKRLLTPRGDGITTLWDVSEAPARPLAQLEGPLGRVRFAVFLPDGQTAVTGGEDRTIRLWNVGTAE